MEQLTSQLLDQPLITDRQHAARMTRAAATAPSHTTSGSRHLTTSASDPVARDTRGRAERSHSQPVQSQPVQPQCSQPATSQWFSVCQLRDLEDSWGEAALINGTQVALFRVGEHHVFAVAQADPATHSHVMSRGVVGSRGACYTIASPLHKEVYSLTTGECFGRPDLQLNVYPVRVVAGAVEVEL